MSTKQILTAALAGLVLVAAGAGTGAWLFAPTEPPATKVATVIEPPRPLPRFQLLAGDGEAFTREDLRGNWHLLFFGFTHCPDICPTTLAKLALVTHALAGSGVDPQVVFVSVDPRRDEPEALAKYVHFYDPDFQGVTGALPQLRKLTGALYLPFSYSGDVQSGHYTVAHGASVVLVDPQARVRAYFTAPHNPARIAADLTRIAQRYAAAGSAAQAPAG